MKQPKMCDILSLRSYTTVRVSLTFQVLRPDGSFSRLYTNIVDLIPGDDIKIDIYDDLVK